MLMFSLTKPVPFPLHPRLLPLLAVFSPCSLTVFILSLLPASGVDRLTADALVVAASGVVGSIYRSIVDQSWIVFLAT